MLKGFLTNLRKYNEGELVGEWVEFPISMKELEEVFERIRVDEECEEFFFSDWDCEFDTGFGEYESICHVNDIAEELLLADQEKVAAIIEATGCRLEDALETVDNAVLYENMSLEDLAHEIVQECYNLPEIAQRYFDYKAFARDLRFDDYYEVASGVIHVR